MPVNGIPGAFKALLVEPISRLLFYSRNKRDPHGNLSTSNEAHARGYQSLSRTRGDKGLVPLPRLGFLHLKHEVYLGCNMMIFIFAFFSEKMLKTFNIFQPSKSQDAEKSTRPAPSSSSKTFRPRARASLAALWVETSAS